MHAFKFTDAPKWIPSIPCIYKITNLINGKIYVGQTVNFKARFSGHKCANGRMLVCKAIRKYGKENFIIEPLVFPEIEELDKEETRCIKLLDSTNLEKGYNLAECSMSARGHKVSDHTREKLRVINRERMRDPTNNPMYGKTHSKQTKQKIRETRERRSKLYKKTSKSIIQVDPITDENIKVHESIVKAALEIGISEAAIIGVLKNKVSKNGYPRKLAGGYKWKYLTQNQ